MLELTRRLFKPNAEEKDQRDRMVIVMPDGKLVTIFLSEIKGYQARLSIEFPEGVGVWRGELWDKMRKEKKIAN